MKSDHIDNRKLSDVINEQTTLDQAELEHLRDCDECLEMVRLLVRQNLSKGVNS